MLPAGVTVQDEHGRFLLVNDAAAARLKVSAEDLLAARRAPLATAELTRRRETCIELLRADRAVVTEECVADGHGQADVPRRRTGRFALPTQNCC